MPELNVLKYNEWVLIHLGIYTKHTPNQAYGNVFFKTLSSYYILLTTSALVVTSGFYIVKYSPQFDVVLRTIAIAIGTAQSVGMYACFGIHLKKVHALHFKLQKIIDESMAGECSSVGCISHNEIFEFTYTQSHLNLDEGNSDPNSAHVSKMANALYRASELNYRKFSKKLFGYGCFQLSTFIAPLLLPIISIYTGNVDTSTWDLPFNTDTPFDMDTILGWLLTWFFQVNVSFAYALAMIPMTISFVGSCFYITSMCNHFKLLIKSMRFDAEQNLWFNVKMKLQQAIERQIDIYE